MDNLIEIIEAVVFTAGKGITRKDILEKMPDLSREELKDAIEELKKKYGGESGLRFLTYNDKVQFSSNPKYGDIVSEVLTPIKEKELSKTMLEVLAIIAYKQPVTRLDIEEIRGVRSEYADAMLQKLDMIYPSGTKDAVGRPTLFSTTEEFLKRFSLCGIEDLPAFEDVKDRVRLIDENYNKVSESLYRDTTDESEEEILDAVAAAIDEDESGEEEIPDFLAGEEVEVIE
jgi:segregation and condensation protein B